MAVNLVVGASTVLQYAAAILAARVLSITGRNTAWLLITVVALLMAIRRTVVLYWSLSHRMGHTVDLAGESLGLAVSALMLVGLWRIGPFFLSVLDSREELRERSRDLGERVKELNCLYQMAGLVEHADATLEDILQGTVNLIPGAWQYPELTCARITVEGQEFTTPVFEETPWKLDQNIVAHSQRVGAVEVYRQTGKGQDNEPFFLEEERHLLNAIAERLGRIIERIRAEEDRESLQERLHEADKIRAVVQLAAGLAHDFSNMLAVIRGHADRAQSMLPDESQARRELEFIQEATHQAADLARALLTFTRKLPTEKRAVDLAALVRESGRLLRRLIPAGIELDLDVAADSPLWVDADQTQLHQVLLNLVINARDAIAHCGKMHISLSPSTPPETGGYREDSAADESFARLVVTDTGVGMTPEVQAHVYEPFYTTKTRGQGTGLGLSIVHGIVQDHGGRIDIRSDPGRGTTVTVWLPCIPTATGEEHAGTGAIAPRGQGELVLLAEADRHVRAVIASTLESLGYEVTLAEDGPTVADLLLRKGDDIQLLVLDADLPGIGGSEGLRRLRAKGLSQPAIMIAGSEVVDPRDLEEGIMLLRRPFGMPELATIVGEALGRPAEQERQP